MTDLQMLGNSFYKFDLVSTYERFSATFRPESYKSNQINNNRLKISQLSRVYVATQYKTDDVLSIKQD